MISSPNRLRQIFLLAVSVICGLALATGLSSPATAVESTDEVSEDQIYELAAYLEYIHSGSLTNANGTFEYQKAVDRFGAEFADAVQVQLDQIEENERQDKQDGTVSLRSAKSYAMCLLDKIGFGGLFGGPTAVFNKIADYLEDKKWKEAAKLISKEAAKRGLKVGVKGGVVGLAAGLAAGSIYCAFKS